jgi:hypothetical protein
MAAMWLVTGTPKMSRWREFDPNAIKARDVLVIVPVVVAILVLIIFFGLSVSHDVYIRWGGLALATVVLFGLFINDSREFFRKWRFWALTVLLLAVHLTVFGIVLTNIGQWKLIWFMAMVLEVPVLEFSRNRLKDP